ncbi:hypothetical protein DM450_23020 (plasmid) [Sphingomonas sp. IC081]|nr:hypothetical protein DM450_23020 [Sphingomonas sp. IC081]
MGRRKSAPIPPAPRKTLLEWIECDDGDTPGTQLPACSLKAQALHARIGTNPTLAGPGISEPMRAPRGLALPPLG